MGSVNWRMGMEPVERLAVIVVAAGEARRLGRDKAALPWGDGTLLGHVVDQFLGPEVARRVVVLNAENEATAREGLPEGVVVALNHDADAEMVVSVGVGLKALGEFLGPVCVHPVDVFAVSRELVTMLYEAWRVEPDCLHLPKVGDKGGHPLIVPPRLVCEIGRIPAGCGLNWLLHEHAGAVRRHAWRDERLLADIDTPADYVRYRPAANPRGGAGARASDPHEQA